MKHVLSARQYTPEDHAEIFDLATEMRHKVHDASERRSLATKHLGLVVATMFYEPSTRTRLSFESAAVRLGAGVISTENAGEFSSAIKGETIEDTAHTVGRLAHAMVLRHKKKGSANEAAATHALPVLNAGDGKGEHPTQALLDLFTIKDKKGRLEDLTVVIGGDLANGRTARSLAMMLSQYKNNTLRFVATPDFQIGEDVKAHLDVNGTRYSQTDEMFDAFEDADAIYWTRLQRERLDHEEVEDIPALPPAYENVYQAVELMYPHLRELTDPEKAKPKPMQPSHFVIDQAGLQAMGPETIIMHPLPRVDEIHISVDADSRAAYFDQVENGLYVRMALLDQILSEV